MKISSLHICVVVALVLIISVIAIPSGTTNNSNNDSENRYIQINGELFQGIEILQVDEDLLVPVDLFEKIGAEVHWDVEAKQAIIKKRGTVIEFISNSTIVAINGQEEKIDSMPYVANDILMVPLNYISEYLGIRVGLSNGGNTVILENPSSLLMHYRQALEIFDIEVTAEVTDVETGVTYKVKRIGGDKFADVEPLTAEDTEKLKYTYDGEWSWRRKAVIVKIGDIEIAGSMAAMPHSGRDDAPFGAIVDNRSGGAGRGINLNSIRDNNMNGVVDIYFYNSLVPGLNRVDERHQHMVLKAAESREDI